MSDYRLVAEMESRIDAFEAARCADQSVDLSQYLPAESDPSYRDILVELVRVDLEFSWRDGIAKTVADYQNTFPDVFNDGARLSELAFEEYRLRWRNGEDVDRETLANRYGVDTDTWPLLPDEPSADDTPSVTAAAMAGPSTDTFAGPPGFEILEEIGKGAVGRVYLARQTDLAQRLVVLKCSTAHWHESDRIARLQHTNIVPIYSVHRVGKLQAICMPYFGKTTLEHVIKRRADEPTKGQVHLSPSTVDRIEADVPNSVSNDRKVGSRFFASSESPQTENYETSCLRIIGQLAEGLDHAHRRGIWHQDIKPANILLADHGKPMLLDFNLARVATTEDSLAAGGTLAYMSPEQIQGLKGRAKIGPWSDLYSLGLVLYEMLAGTTPFKSTPNFQSDDFSSCIVERQTPPQMSAVHRSVSPAISSILRRCLEPKPADRYQSANELVEDIQRHLNDLPLRHAPNISFRERLAKWARRHPRIASASTVSVAAAACLVLIGAFALWQRNEVARLNGIDQIESLSMAVEQARAPLTVPGTSAELVSKTGSNLEKAIAAIGVTPNTWRDWQALSVLDNIGKRRFSNTIGHAFYLLANLPRNSLDAEGIQNALHFNYLAEDAFAMVGVPNAVYLQRASLGGNVKDVHLHESDIANASARDLTLQAGEHMRNGEFQIALDVLQRAKQRFPKDFNAHLLLGNCHQALGDVDQAILDFTSAASLWPSSHVPYFFRGLSRLELGEYLAAEDDFCTVLKIQPQSNAALLNRALARIRQNRLRDALGDLDRMIDSGNAPTRTYLLRAKVRKRTGDLAGADQDRQKGLSLAPTDEASQIAQAVARLPDDPRRCKADLEEVLRANPASTSALQNLAHVCSEYLDSPDEAIGYLNRLLTIRQTDQTALAGRGVLHARSGNVVDALRDAEAVANRPVDATNAYQIACLYALNVPSDPSHGQKAMKYLAAAIRQDTKWAQVAPIDEDLANLRGVPQFQRLVAAGKLLTNPLQETK